MQIHDILTKPEVKEKSSLRVQFYLHSAKSDRTLYNIIYRDPTELELHGERTSAATGRVREEKKRRG